MPDLDDIEEAIAQAAIDPASASVDGQSVTAQDPLKSMKVADRVTARQASASGLNPFDMLYRAVAGPPGA